MSEHIWGIIAITAMIGLALMGFAIAFGGSPSQEQTARFDACLRAGHEPDRCAEVLR